MIRNLTKFNINNSNDKFENINFDFLMTNDFFFFNFNVNESQKTYVIANAIMTNDSTNFNFCTFKNTILQTLDETVPYKAINSSRFSKFPWLNQELVNLLIKNI